MAEPPPTVSSGDKTTGPLCPICNKPYNEHSWIQKQNCSNKMKKEDIKKIREEEQESLR